ncbi:hypothetical protein ACHAWF_004017 [Thalassiosira exigua]
MMESRRRHREPQLFVADSNDNGNATATATMAPPPPPPQPLPRRRRPPSSLPVSPLVLLSLAALAFALVAVSVSTVRTTTTAGAGGSGSGPGGAAAELDYLSGGGAPPSARPREEASAREEAQSAGAKGRAKGRRTAALRRSREGRGGKGGIARGGDDENDAGDDAENDNGDGRDADDDDDPRPRKRPRGRRWRGWPEARGGDNDGENDGNDDSNDNGSNDNGSNDNGNDAGSAWWRRSSKCFEIDRVCHRREFNEWFYYSPPPPADDAKIRTPPFQPTMELKPAAAKYDGGKDVAEKRIKIKLSSESKATSEEMSWEKMGASFVVARKDADNGTRGGGRPAGGGRCEISSTPTHVVLQSLFNDMIGEFYARTLLRLYKHMTRGAETEGDEDAAGEGDAINNNKRKRRPWEEDVQFYVHVPYGNKKMLDGHRLLLGGMQSDPAAPVARSFVDLFRFPAPETDGKGVASDEEDCRCYEKMVFCGYDVFAHPTDVRSEDLEEYESEDERKGGGEGGEDENDNDGGDDNDDNDNEDEDNDDEDNDNEARQLGNKGLEESPTADTKYTLWCAGKLSSDDSKVCGRSAAKYGEAYACRDWGGLRDFLSRNFVRRYPSLERDVVARRRAQLADAGVLDDSYPEGGDTAEFTIVGLTQRTYRRSWINLPEVLEKCNAAGRFERVLCVEVNVEKTTSPYEQLLLHRSLDVLIGVHGAQLTQAVLLPPRAHVLELLPWVPPYIRGKWVRTTHVPTPLGVIFHNTDLNHAGYSLDRSSVPLCEGVGEEALQTCFLKRRKHFIWENRDFNVDPEPMLRYLETFVLPGRRKDKSCEELWDGLDDERFVLYNVWCRKPRYWYPSAKGECVRGAGYPLDHTVPRVRESSLFDDREGCCAAFPDVCREVEGARKGGSSTSSPGKVDDDGDDDYDYALFHMYHKEEPESGTPGGPRTARRARRRAKARRAGEEKKGPAN